MLAEWIRQHPRCLMVTEWAAEVCRGLSRWFGRHWWRYTAISAEHLSDLMFTPLLLFSRLVAVIVLPAQLPGNVSGMMEDLMQAPVATIRSWERDTVCAILKQLVFAHKLEIPNDPQPAPAQRRLKEAR